MPTLEGVIHGNGELVVGRRGLRCDHVCQGDEGGGIGVVECVLAFGNGGYAVIAEDCADGADMSALLL